MMKIGEEANSVLELPSVFIQMYKSLSIQMINTVMIKLTRKNHL